MSREPLFGSDSQRMAGLALDATIVLDAGSAEIYDGSKAGEDFLGWLDSINAFDIYGNSSAVWPGSYQGN